MERLEFGRRSRYVAIEAAIHTARYLAVKSFCSGRRVLDIACGEGYGCWLMSQWGASTVRGVDNSLEAVSGASARFSSPTTHFVHGTAEALTLAVGEEKYDLIVSLETIEHVDDPALFLRNIKAVAAPGATIVISAPNDYWYYDEGEANEFHKRKFTFEEFRALTESELGSARSWSMGTLGIGFSITSEECQLKSGGPTNPQELMLNFQPIDAAVYVPPQIESDATSAEVAFYLGVWGKEPMANTIFAGYPVSMNLGRQPLFPKDGIWAIKPDPSAPQCKTLQSQYDDLIELYSSAQLELTQLNSLLALRAQDNAALKSSIDRLEGIERQLTTELNCWKSTAESSKIELDTTREQLYFMRKEVDRFGMTARASRAEIELAWRANWRHENVQRDQQQWIHTLTSEIETLKSNLALAVEAENAARARLTEMPWRLIRLWWQVRQRLPVSMLRMAGRILRKSHAS